MAISSNPVETLRNPEVKKYFLELLKSSSPAEERYGALLRFFELDRDVTNRLERQLAGLPQGDPAALSRAVAAAAADSGVWQPELILQRTKESLERALRRVGQSQHPDGGWGFKFRESHLWATAWTVILLRRAAEAGLDADQAARKKGETWLIDNRSRWSLDPGDEGARGNSVYDASVAMQTLFANSPAALPGEVSRSIERSLARLLEEQRPEGDWEATLWGNSSAAVHDDRREVGATSFALQALAAAGRREIAMEEAAAHALQWLAAQQNPDGSWNASYVPPGTPGPQASVGKTCDALRGFLAGQRLGIDLAPYRKALDQGIQWLVGQEEAQLNAEGRIVGWFWQGEPGTAKGDLEILENTCLTLETLLDFETVPLPQLAANALWLLSKQQREEGSPDDGKWANDDTGRIACAILSFYLRITASPLFQVGAAPAAPVAQEAVV